MITGVSARRGGGAETRRAAGGFLRRQGQRARRFRGAAAGNAARNAGANFSARCPRRIFFTRRTITKNGCRNSASKSTPATRAKDATYAGADGFATWLRTTWLPYVQRVPENLREEFIAAVTERYLAKHPPDADGQVHVRMVRLEIDAEKI